MDGEPGIFAVPPGAPSMTYDIVLISNVELAGMIATHIMEVPTDPKVSSKCTFIVIHGMVLP